MNFDFLRCIFAGDDNAPIHTADTPLTAINPTTGLPMLDNGLGGVDVGGSPFGMDVHNAMCDGFTGGMDSNPWD